jgi:autotransporter-associated beta strand protein
MSKKLNNSLAIGIFLIGILFGSISEGFSQTTNYFTWNNTSTNWTTATAWTPNGGPQLATATANTNVAIFASTGVGNNTVSLSSDRTLYGLIFTNGANSYSFASIAVTGTNVVKQLDIMSNMGLANNSSTNQIFNLTVNNNGNATWSTAAGATTTFNNGLNLTTASSSANRTLTLGGAGTWNVASTLANGGTATNGAVTITATGTTTLSGNNTYDGRTTMNAAGGTLTLSGNNSGAGGGVTLTAGTLNLNNANAVGTGVLDLGVVTGSSYGSSIINNTSGGALTYLGLSGVVWTGVNPAGIQFGTSGSTSANNMDFGSGLVTAATDRSMNIAGTGVTISMGTLTASGTAGSYTYKIDGVGNTLDLDGWRISGAATPTQAVQHKISGTANVNIGTIENGTGAFANSAVFMTDGTTRLTGNNTYTGTTEFIGSGTNIISGNNSAAVGNVKIAGDTGKTPVVRLDNVNGISSSSSLLGASGTAQIGTLDLRAAGNFSLNSFGTVVAAGNNMIFTNSSGSQKTLAFTAANNYITTATTGGRTLYNNSENLLLDFDGNIEIGGTSAAAEATTFAGVGNFNVDGNLTDTGSGLTRTLRKTGDGTLTLRGSANSIRGSTLLERGELDLYGSVTASTNIVVSTSGAVSATSTTRAATATLDVKNGGSLLASSTTTVYSGGNLIVNGTAGSVVLESNGLLGGSGAVGNVELKSGSLLNPGNSPGLLTAASSSWAAGSTYNWEIDQASGGTAGVNWDVFSVVGALDLSALSSTAQMNLVLNSLPSMDDFSSTTAYSWVIAQAGSFTGTGLADGTNVTSLFNIDAADFNSGVGPSGGFKVEVGTDANNLRTLNLMAVPEPSTGSMLGLGFAGLVATRLLRRKIS